MFQTSKKIGIGFALLVGFFLGNPTHVEAAVDDDGHYREKIDLTEYADDDVLIHVDGGTLVGVNNWNENSDGTNGRYEEDRGSFVTSSHYRPAKYHDTHDYELIIDAPNSAYSVEVFDGASQETAYDFTDVSIKNGNAVLIDLGGYYDGESYITFTLEKGREYAFELSSDKAFKLLSPDGSVIKAYDKEVSWDPKQRNGDVFFTYTPTTTGTYAFLNEDRSVGWWAKLLVYEVFDPEVLSEMEPLVMNDGSADDLLGLRYYGVKVDKKKPYILSPKWDFDAGYHLSLNIDHLIPTDSPDEGNHDAYDRKHTFGKSFAESGESQPQAFYSGDGNVQLHRHEWSKAESKVTIDLNASSFTAKSGDAAKAYVEVLNAENREASRVADPVDAFAGNFVDNRELLSYSGNNPLAFQLSYDSIANSSASLRGGFVHNYETYLKETDKGLSVYWSPNSVVHFESVDGQYKPVHAKQSEVSVTKSDSGFTVTDADKQVFTFDLEGKLLKKTDKVGQQTEYAYTNGLLTSVENSKGQFFTFNYTSDGKLLSVEDAMKRTLNFRYENELLVGITTPNGTELKATYVAAPSSTLPFKVSELTYDGVTLVKNQYDARGRVLKQWDGKKVLTNFTYDEFSNDDQIVTTITTGSRKEVLTHDRLGNLLQKTDGEGFSESHTYDENQNVLSTVDKNGHQYEYAYDAKNRLVLTKNPDNTTVAYAYGEDNNITKITMPDGKTVKNTYENGRLIESTDRAGNKTSYTYDTFGNATRIKRDGHDVNYTYGEGTGYLTSVSTNDGSVTQFENDVLGRVIKTILPDETFTESVYDVDNNVIKTTDQKGQESEFTYNAFGNVLTEKNPKDIVTTHEYDANGNRIHSKIGEREVGYEYNDYNELTKSFHISGRSKTTIQTLTYNDRGDLTKSENADKISTTMTYDGNGDRLTEATSDSVTTYTYDVMGNNTEVTDSYGNRTVFTYDTVGNVLSETTPSGSMIKHQYDDMNRLITTTDALGHQTNYTYDPRGNVVRVTDANGTETTYEYNDNNQQTAEINALGERQTHTYNALGQLVAVKNNRDELVLSYEYDALGQISKTTDGNGHTNTFTYDANGNRLTVTDGLGQVSETVSYNTYDELSETTDALGNRTAYGYDTIGQLSKETDPNGNTTTYQHSATTRLNKVTDASGNWFNYGYDEYGLLAMTQSRYSKNQEFDRDLNQNITSEGFNGNTLSYAYNTDNELVKKTNGRKQELNYAYDKNGRLIKETLPDGVTTYEYDAVGNALVVESDDSRIERTYDVLGRVTSKTQDGQTIKYGYDDRGDLVRMDYPTGESVDYTYDVMGNLLTVTDWNGRKTEYTYNENNQLIKTTHANGTEELRTYDDKGQVLTLINKKDSSVISSYAYEYDANGNIVKENDLVLKYDGLNRLTQAGQNTYKYNPTGDITEATAIQADGSSYKQTMAYDSASALTRLNGASTSVDNDGNLTKYKLNNETHNATYNSSNQLVSFDDVTYKYDGERNRINLSDGDTETSFVIDNDSSELSRVLVEETDGESIYHVYGHGLIGSYSADGSFETHHYDYRGSTTGVTDESGTVLGSVAYDEYGVITHRDETITTRFLYNGQHGVQTDSNGLYYMRARFYNPDLKRFMNRDVVMGSITEPQTLNRYAFVNGNPISYHDPFGLARETLSNKVSGIGHGLLDGVGLIPVFGEVFDLANAAWYLAEGDFTNAAWSSMALIPIVGNASTGLKYVDKGLDAVKFAGKYTDDVAELGAKGYNKVTGTDGLLKMDLQMFAKKPEIKPIKEFDVTTYSDFVKRSVVGDNLEGHELWQHANLKKNGLATTRNSTKASKNNPVISLKKEHHKVVNKKQYKIDGANQQPYDNIMSNAQILSESDVPDDVVDDIKKKALSHMYDVFK